MYNFYQNITQLFLLQSAISAMLDKIGMEINTHAACTIINNSVHQDLTANNLFLNDIPTIASDCQLSNNDLTNFVNQMQQSVAIGCSFFIVSEECALPFLDNFQEIHDWVEQKYERKVLLVIDTKNELTFEDVMDLLNHRIIINEIPLTLILQINRNDEWFDVWSAYPYSSPDQIYNRFFVSNFSFEYAKPIIPIITDLNGLKVTGAFIHYPPYTAYYHVPAGTGNANLFNSNQSLEIRLDGQEHILLVEFCIEYNCTLTARLDYDEALWGDMYDNHTGRGLIGAITVRDANVSCAALYLWDNTYYFSQYSAIIQRATITHIVPKPVPLPYWQTPLLPFPSYIWGYVIGAFLIGAVVLFLVNITQTKINKDKSDSQSTYGLFDSIYAVYMMSIFQGVNININFISNIVIFTILLIYALVIGNLYAGGLASVMTITRFEEPVDTLEKLVESKFLWGSTALSWIFTLQKSDYPPHKKYVEKYLIKTIPEVLQLTQQHRMAVMLETMQDGTLTYQPFIDKDSSYYYMMMKKQVYWQGTYIMTSKTWPFMEQLNRMVLMQQESGIRYYWEQSAGYRLMDYGIQRNIEENSKPPDGGEPVKLSIQHILGALLLLLFGNAFSSLTFVLEILWNYNKKRVDRLLSTLFRKVQTLYNKVKLL